MKATWSFVREMWCQPKGWRWFLVAMTIFLGLAFAVNHSFFTYDYHMDDAWIIGVNHQENTLSAQEGIEEAFATIKKQYSEQWHEQQRFPGFLPIARFIQVNLISPDVRVHLIINLTFHALNALLLYVLLVRLLQVRPIPALAFSGLFALGLNLGSGSYALSLWIGSFSVNLLTLFLLMCLAVSGRVAISNSRPVLILLYAVYAILALGNYALAVLLPPLAVVYFMRHQDVRRTLGFLLALSSPIIANLIVRSFAPKSTYVGTTLKLDVAHIWNNLLGNLAALLGAETWLNVGIVALLLATVAYGRVKKILSTLEILLPVFLVLGMTGLYSLSARDAFYNPYFLYIPYAGLVVLLGLATKAVIRADGSPQLAKNIGILSAVMMLGAYQYVGAKEYRQLRKDSSIQIGNIRKDFKKIEEDTRFRENGLVAILYESIPSTALLGYFNRTVNTWRSKENKTRYILVSKFIPNADAGNIMVKTGYSQYSSRGSEFRKIGDIQHAFHINSNKFHILKVVDGKVKLIDLMPKSFGVVVDTSYDTEQYGDGKKYSWTDRNAQFYIYSAPVFAGREAVLSFTVTPLLHDKIEVTYGGHRKILDITAQRPVRLCQRITLGEENGQVKLKTWKNSVPPGDVRNLSFRVDHDFDIRLIEKSLHLGEDLSGYELSGIYGLEQEYFRWVQPEASISLPGCMPAYRSAKLLLRGSFPMGSAPLIVLNQSIVPTRIKRTDKNTVEYIFDDLDEELRVVTLRSKRYKTEYPEPRELGFMFNSLDIEFELKGAD